MRTAGFLVVAVASSSASSATTKTLERKRKKVASASTAAAVVTSHPPHDPSVSPVLEWFTSPSNFDEPVYYNPKQTVRRASPTSAFVGVFANDVIDEGELLCSVPWNATINAGYEVTDPTHLICDTVHSLASEMRSVLDGQGSPYEPYVRYLLDQRRGQLPSAYSDMGKALLRRVLDMDALPPREAVDILVNDWYGACGGSSSDDDTWLEEHAAMLVIQRAEDDLMLPVYDFYNHRNGDSYLNTINSRNELVSFDVRAARTIDEGEQIYISYNMCANCGNRAESYGTPEMFRDYGFVEPFPQRWTFPGEAHGEGFFFDLLEADDDNDENDNDNDNDNDMDENNESDKHETKDTIENGKETALDIVWNDAIYPHGDAKVTRMIMSFRTHVRRLERLRKMEHLEREKETVTSDQDDKAMAGGVPQAEWDAIWSYADAMVRALKLALKDMVDKDHVFEGGSYDTLLDGINDGGKDGVFYEDIPYGYTASCDNEQTMMFHNRIDHEYIETIYQSMTIFEMPPSDDPVDYLRDGDVCLELDRIIQSCGIYRPHYHELVFDYPARYLPLNSIRRVLFVGGGDSMILEEAMKYSASLELIVGLELDQAVTRTTFTYFHTRPYFHDAKRVEWWFGDATKSLAMIPRHYYGSFDLVLVDLSETVASFPVTEELDLFGAMALLLAPNGILVKNEWRDWDKMNGLFRYTARVNMRDVPYICDQAMIFGSNGIDFFNTEPVDHGVERRLLGPYVSQEERYTFFHDYQVNRVAVAEAPDTNETVVTTTLDDVVIKDGGDDDERGGGLLAGILMIVNAEDVTMPLWPIEDVRSAVALAVEGLELTVIKTVVYPSSSSNNNEHDDDDDDNNNNNNKNSQNAAFTLLLKEGYITARAWPGDKYCALDLHLWGAFDMHNAVRDAVLDAIGGSNSVGGDGDTLSWSAYRIVTGGMRGYERSKDDQRGMGPPPANASRNRATTTAAAAAATTEAKGTKDVVESTAGAVEAALVAEEEEKEDTGKGDEKDAAEALSSSMKASAASVARKTTEEHVVVGSSDATALLDNETKEETEDVEVLKAALRTTLEILLPDDDMEHDEDENENEDSTAALVVVVCGLDHEPCPSRDALGLDVVVLHTCADIVDENEDEDAMIRCEAKTTRALFEATSTTIGWIGAVVVDGSVPLSMVRVLHGIFSTVFNRHELLSNRALFVVLMTGNNDDGTTWVRKHNFLDRIRRDIAEDPLSRAEIVLTGAGAGLMRTLEVGIFVSHERAFFRKLRSVVGSIESRTGWGASVRRVLGGQWDWQEDYYPTTFTEESYDAQPGLEQFENQRPLGRQSVFQLEFDAKVSGQGEGDATALSRADIESALFYSFALMGLPIDELKATAQVGDGFALAALSSEGGAVVVWDGHEHVDINLFSYDEDEDRATKFVTWFKKKLPMKLVQRDEQPRGTGRVINFSSDIYPEEKNGEEVHKRQLAAQDGEVLYECPTGELETGKNDIAGYFNYYDDDNDQHSRRGRSEDDYYLDGFRDVKFGGREQTYSQLKEMTKEYKVRAFGDNLQSGDKIYEGACGEAFNLLMTMEILREERNIVNLTAYGHDYLATSTEVANNLFDAQASTYDWLRKGQFCRADSTDISFVPSDTFDLAYTYVDPLVDPLDLHEEDTSFEERVEFSRRLCGKDNERTQSIVREEQLAQEEWHSSWVKELIRIVKPGKVVIIEDVDSPVCDETSNWGGVSTDWWKGAVETYGWDVDPDSIEIVERAWYENRYNVLMRKNDGPIPSLDRTDELSAPPAPSCAAKLNLTMIPKSEDYWNEEWNVHNAIEVDVDTNIIKEIWADYEKDVRPYLNSGHSTDDFCLVAPYTPGTETWSGEDEEGVLPDGTMRSDIKWFSVRNEKTYQKYMRHVERLGVMDIFKGTWIDADKITVYAMFFIPRSFSKAHHYHIDWDERCHTQVMTFLIPLNEFNIHLKYKDDDDEERDYRYTVGKAIGFGGGFVHSTGLGQGEEEDVLLCVYMGGDDPRIWEYAKHNIADELEHYMDPIKGFIRNEGYPDQDICQ